MTEEKTEKHLGLRIAFWLTALLVLLAFCCFDLYQLYFQYKENKPVTIIGIKDDSISGIRLPNASICLHYEDEYERDWTTVLTTFNYSNFQQKDLKDALKLAYIFTRMDDASTNVHMTLNQLTVNFLIDKKKFISNHNVTFWNQLAKHLCQTMLMDLRLYTKDVDGHIEIPMCEDDDGNPAPFPFTIVARGGNRVAFCFRLPFDLLPLSNSPVRKAPNFHFKPSVGIHEHKIVFTFQPLALRQYIPAFNHRVSIATSVPENLMPIGHHNDILSLFHNELNYPTTIDYAKSTEVFVEVAMSGKYTPLGYNNNCTNVHDERACTEKCMEEEFSTVCRCNRFLYRHYVPEPKYRYCTKEDYEGCFDNYHYSIWAKDNFTEASHTRNKCIEKCDKCSKIFYQFLTKQTQTNQDGWYEDWACRKYENVLNKHKIDCQTFIQLDKKYINDSVHDLNKKYADYSANNRPVFGSVTYNFMMKSFSYPVFVERKSITFEDFKSQIGGIFGLYLGVSVLTIFTVILQCVELTHKYRNNRKEAKENATVSRKLTDIAQMIRVVSAFQPVATNNSQNNKTDDDQESVALKDDNNERENENIAHTIAELSTNVADLRKQLQELKTEMGKP